MSQKTSTPVEPDWLNPANDRKTPYTDAELDRFAMDFIAMNRDVPVWRNLIAKVGEQVAIAVARQRLAVRDPQNFANLKAAGPVN